MHHECHFLAAWRYRNLGGARTVYLSHEVAVVLVGHNLNIHLLRLSSRYKGIYLTVISEAQLVIRRCRKEAHWIAAKAGELTGSTSRHLIYIYIKSSVLLAEIVIRLPVGTPHWIAVLTGKRCQFAEGTILVKPDVAGNR